MNTARFPINKSDYLKPAPNWYGLALSAAVVCSATATGQAAPVGALGAKAAPATPSLLLTPKPTSVAEKPAQQPPAEVVAHLKNAGLDAKDPALGAKLKALALQHGAAYVRNHVLSMAPVVVKKATPPPLLAQAAGVARNAVRTTQPVAFAPESGSMDRWVALSGSIYAPNPDFVANVGALGWFVHANHLVAPGGSNGSYGIAFDCGGVNANGAAFAVNANENIVKTFFPDAYNSSLIGPPYLHVAFLDMFDNAVPLPIGRKRNGKITIHFDNVTATATTTFAPTQAMVTIAATIDHTPTLTSVRSVSPWGSTGLSAQNATLQNAGTPRIGAGDWTVTTQGSDLVGDGVQLGPGWTVTSTVIKSAFSATTPQDLSPDSSWRGAKVTQMPSPGTLRTGVVWHYGGVDSLDYTIEWTLTGPLGQRPLMTMAKHDSCDS